MSRVLVSHRWMGDSLQELLERLPGDVRMLARSLTAIVIASDIRPAYYWPRTGALYLDAEYFWRTPEERAKDVAIVGTEGDARGVAVVAWGQRGRMTDPNVVDRTRFVIDAIYPDDLGQLHRYLDARPAPLPMRPGDTWAENVVLDGGAQFNVPPPHSAGGRASGVPSARSTLVGCLRADGLPAAFRERLGVVGPQFPIVGDTTQ
ncbi:MAG: hypothetical protein OXG82_08400 [Gammaproteobacteria bacterium]|nr:hypothetical protein [Gammaproteobacteria bacterium]